MNYFDKLAKAAQHAATEAEKAAQHAAKQAAEAYEAASPHVQAFTEQAGDTARAVHKQVTQFTSDPSKSVTLDEVGRRLASLGAPAIAFAIAASAATGMGLAGGAVVTTALAMVGGPAGMIGGLVVLGSLTAIADWVAKFGIDQVLLATFRAKQAQGEDTQALCDEINSLWISTELKLKLKHDLGLL